MNKCSTILPACTKNSPCRFIPLLFLLLDTPRLQALELEMLAFENLEDLAVWLAKVAAEIEASDRHDEERSYEVN